MTVTVSLVPTQRVAAPTHHVRFRPSGRGAWAVRFTVLGYSVLVFALVTVASPFAVVAIAAPIGVLVGIWGLSRPEGLVSLMLLTLFLREALPQVFGMDPFLPAFAGVIAAVGIHVWRNHGRMPQVATLEVLIALYIAWNVFSLLQPHYFDTLPGPPDTRPVWRFIATGTVIPLAMYVVGRVVFRTEKSARLLLWTVIGYGAYSAIVSILQFHAPALVWPRYIIDDLTWVGRANGVPNQPVMNGLLMVSGYLAAALVGSSQEVGRLKRGACLIVILMTSYGVYLTHTRVAWLAYVVVTLAGAVLMPRARRYFVTVLALVMLLIVAQWSTFTSTDRAAGGVGSINEIDDRLNLIATQIWAFKHEPWFGYGIGTFPTLNTYDHQQWSLAVPWVRGWAIASHQNELGILVELGLVGLVLWLGILLLVWRNLLRAIRNTDPMVLEGRPYTLIAALMLFMLILCGFTVDLRFFDFTNALVFLVVGSAVAVGESAQIRRLSGAASTTTRAAPTAGLEPQARNPDRRDPLQADVQL